jgi:cholesterol oxidase
MKMSRRNFIAGSLGLTMGGCASLGSGPRGENPVTAKRDPSGGKPLGYRLSSPNESLKPHYAAVVVGSGYGASVIAARLSGQFPNMCVLERGKEWHPGDFASTPSELGHTFKSPLDPLGLIDIEQGRDIDIVCGNGLGGTSLINAAIAIRPEFNVFDLPVWPQEISGDARNGTLEKFYQRAESVLQPMRLDQARFSKSRLHRRDAASLSREWGELTLNIRGESFGETRENDFGYPQSKCVQCGNCCSGCNYGAKNTLVTNYLYLAYKRGVQIFTQVEVESIEKSGGRYQLNLKLIPAFGVVKRKQITADMVFLGAGAKGSTQILMRSESDQFRFSESLGTRLSANGDVMGLSYNTNSRTDSIARDPAGLKNGGSRSGLIISSYANYRKPSLEGDVQSQFLLLDGVVPSAFASTVAKALAVYATANQTQMYGALSAAERKTKMDRIALDITGESQDEGALNHSMLYFACGHDSSGGRFFYDRRRKLFSTRWKDVLKEPTFRRIDGVMRQFANVNGGSFIQNPRTTVFGENIQATHPLGGCPMGEDAKSGVVNHLGRVYDSANSGFHDGLFVVDASIIPHSLSATPLLTITALAERIAEHFLKS